MNKTTKKKFQRVLRLEKIALKLENTTKVYDCEKTQKRLENKNKTASKRLYKKIFLLQEEVCLDFEKSLNSPEKEKMRLLAFSFATKAGLVEQSKKYFLP